MPTKICTPKSHIEIPQFPKTKYKKERIKVEPRKESGDLQEIPEDFGTTQLEITDKDSPSQRDRKKVEEHSENLEDSGFSNNTTPKRTQRGSQKSRTDSGKKFTIKKLKP